MDITPRVSALPVTTNFTRTNAVRGLGVPNRYRMERAQDRGVPLKRKWIEPAGCLAFLAAGLRAPSHRKDLRWAASGLGKRLSLAAARGAAANCFSVSCASCSRAACLAMQLAIARSWLKPSAIGS